MIKFSAIAVAKHLSPFFQIVIYFGSQSPPLATGTIKATAKGSLALQPLIPHERPKPVLLCPCISRQSDVQPFSLSLAFAQKNKSQKFI